MNTPLSRFAIILVVLFVGSIEESQSQLVTTSLGQIQGTTMKSLNGTTFSAFRGIKYAKAPTGNRRFSAPEKVDAWTGTLQATTDSLICPQTGDKASMSEDCLAINVYSRNINGKAPVIVYIHGGSNKKGSGHSVYEAGPQYLMDHDIVFVSFNYRLGALGFLVTNDTTIRGNFGYLDQVVALQFVRDHINRFGGDPNSVTLLGMSAGSMAISLHLTAAPSYNLFHRAILMSGSATNTYSIDNKFWTHKLAHETSCPQYNGTDMVDCLRTLNWETIIDTCSRWEPYGFTNMKWNYEIDYNFLWGDPTWSFISGDFRRVPLIVGITKDELDFNAYHQENNARLLHDIDQNFDKYSPELFLFDKKNDAENARVSKSIHEFYFGKNGTINSTTIETFGRIFSDSIIGDGVNRLVQMTKNHTDVYYYRMDYKGQRSLYKDTQGKPRGVGHADDLQYVMPSTWYGAQMDVNNPDIFMVHRITKWFATFAKTGSPTQNNEWKPANNTTSYTMHNSLSPVLVNEFPYMDRYNLWDELFPYGLPSGSGHLSGGIASLILCVVGALTRFLF